MLKLGTEVRTRIRGRMVTAVVAGSHWLKRKGKTRRLAQQVTGDAGSLDRDLIVLVSMDETIHYRCEEHSCKPTGKKVSDRKAVQRLNEVKATIANSKFERADEAYDAGRETGLRDCEIGDTIEVNFNDYGWTEVEFAGFVQRSGNVRYIYRGRKRSMHPRNARPKK